MGVGGWGGCDGEWFLAGASIVWLFFSVPGEACFESVEMALFSVVCSSSIRAGAVLRLGDISCS